MAFERISEDFEEFKKITPISIATALLIITIIFFTLKNLL